MKNVGGFGMFSKCKGEGYVSEKMSEESVERARMIATNMAT